MAEVNRIDGLLDQVTLLCNSWPRFLEQCSPVCVALLSMLAHVFWQEVPSGSAAVLWMHPILRVPSNA